MMCPEDNFNIIQEFKIRMNDQPKEKLVEIVEELFKEELYDYQFNEIEKVILNRIYSDIYLLLKMYNSGNPLSSHPDTFKRFYNEVKELFEYILINGNINNI
jgi:hypothetical protein